MSLTEAIGKERTGKMAKTRGVLPRSSDFERVKKGEKDSLSSSSVPQCTLSVHIWTHVHIMTAGSEAEA